MRINRFGMIRHGVVLMFGVLMNLVVLQPGYGAGSDTFSLDWALIQARQNNPDLIQQREAVRQARFGLSRVTATGWPSVQASADYTRQPETQLGTSTFQQPDDWGAALSMSVPIYRGGKLGYEELRSSHQLDMERARMDHREEQVLFEVATLYLQLLNARRTIEIQETSLERARRFLDNARALYEVGEQTRTAVLQARVRVTEAERGLEQSSNQHQQLRDQLALALGREQLPGRPVTEVRVDSPTAGSETYLREAINNRRDLQQYRENVEALQASVNAERADYWPNVNLTGRHSWQRESVRAPDGTNWNVTLGISVPLYDGGVRSAELGLAQSRLRQARTQLNHQKQVVRNQVRNALREIESQQTVVETLETQLEAARENHQRVNEQFEEGLVSSLEVVDASATLVETENLLINSRFDLKQSYLNLERVIGRFFEDRVQPLRTGER